MHTYTDDVIAHELGGGLLKGRHGKTGLIPIDQSLPLTNDYRVEVGGGQ